MLKITAIDKEGQRTLVLEGKLADPWLPELERSWSEARNGDNLRTVLIDLKDVTWISERGEVFLRQMMSEGAVFSCCRGVLTRHVLQRLMQGCRLRPKKQDVQT